MGLTDIEFIEDHHLFELETDISCEAVWEQVDNGIGPYERHWETGNDKRLEWELMELKNLVGTDDYDAAFDAIAERGYEGED